MKIPERLRSLATRMRPGEGARRPGLSETIALVRAYVIQETLAPLRTLGRTLAFGLAGALVSAIGVVFLLVGVLRVLETETGTFFAGSWNFAPYLLTAATGLAVVALLALATLRVIRHLGPGSEPV